VTRIARVKCTWKIPVHDTRLTYEELGRIFMCIIKYGDVRVEKLFTGGFVVTVECPDSYEHAGTSLRSCLDMLQLVSVRIEVSKAR